MKKKALVLSLVSMLALSGTAVISEFLFNNRPVKAGQTFEDPDRYDYWLNSWSKPGHVYVHYNRGNKNDYNDFCLWLWNDSTDTDGTLWAYGGKTDVSDTLTLNPMSTHWMYESDIPNLGSSNNIYKDDYGVIADVDLTLALKTGKIQHKKGEAANPENASYDNCDDLGFLFPKCASMDGSSHWTSDGGKDNDIDDWKDEENWRSISNDYGTGKALHIFLSTGQLNNWSYFAGSGIPEVKVNPMDVDTTGHYSSKVDTSFLKSWQVTDSVLLTVKLSVNYTELICHHLFISQDHILP